MAKSEEARLREQRLAAKLRENLKRRKGQQKARANAHDQAPPGAQPDLDHGKKP